VLLLGGRALLCCTALLSRYKVQLNLRFIQMNPNHAYQSLPDDFSEDLETIRDDNEERSLYYRKIRRNFAFLALTVFAVMLSVSVVQSHYETTSTNLSTSTDTSSPFTLSSSAFVANGTLPDIYTCKNGTGLGFSPPLSWSNVPEGTVELYVTMGKVSGYDWSVYAIPPDSTELVADNEHMASDGTIAVGVNGGTEAWYIDEYPFIDVSNYVSKQVYDEPCSTGPGAKWYKFTLYAFDTPVAPVMNQLGLEFTPTLILNNMQNNIIGQSSLTVTFTLTEEIVLEHITDSIRLKPEDSITDAA
jgi:phosphatidylethanolamine-binding protein (PEBP) family uncharacterized protein